MFDDITRFAALVSSSLQKVDRDTLSSNNSTGPANRINVRNFITPNPAVDGAGPPPAPIQPAVQPQFIPPPQPPAIVGRVEPLPQPTQTNKVLNIDNNVIAGIAESLQDIAAELNKINKKLVSVQKYYNQQLNKNDNTILNES